MFQRIRDLRGTTEPYQVILVTVRAVDGTALVGGTVYLERRIRLQVLDGMNGITASGIDMTVQAVLGGVMVLFICMTCGTVG